MVPKDVTLPSIYDLKPKFQALLRPLCAALAKAGITANQVTLFACLISIAHGLWLALADDKSLPLLLLPLTLFIRMALNAIDGMLAREFDMKSKLGAILNELTDVISDAALYLPFALIAGVSAPLIVLLVIAALLTEMIGVIGLQIGASRRYDGPFGKSDRAVFFGLLGLVLGLGVAPGFWLDILLGVALLASAFTIFNRARGALSEKGGSST